MTDTERELLASVGGTQVAGTPDYVVDELLALAARTGAAELMLTAMSHDVATSIRTLELVMVELDRR